MTQDYLNWTKTYNLNHKDGLFNIYVSSHNSEAPSGYVEDYIGCVLYYVWNKTRINKSTSPAFTFKWETFVGVNENEVYNQCIKWVDMNLPGKYNVELRKQD